MDRELDDFETSSCSEVIEADAQALRRTRIESTGCWVGVASRQANGPPRAFEDAAIVPSPPIAHSACEAHETAAPKSIAGWESIGAVVLHAPRAGFVDASTLTKLLLSASRCRSPRTISPTGRTARRSRRRAPPSASSSRPTERFRRCEDPAALGRETQRHRRTGHVVHRGGGKPFEVGGDVKPRDHFPGARAAIGLGRSEHLAGIVKCDAHRRRRTREPDQCVLPVDPDASPCAAAGRRARAEDASLIVGRNAQRRRMTREPLHLLAAPFERLERPGSADRIGRASDDPAIADEAQAGRRAGHAREGAGPRDGAPRHAVHPPSGRWRRPGRR